MSENQNDQYNFLDLFGGEKGGVGKTFVAKTAIQYQIDRGYKFIAVETDRSNPDVAKIYPKYCKYSYFTENDKKANKADQIFELALKRNTIVNLPAQVQTPLKTWFETNNLFDLGEEYGVVFRKWFVTNGEFDSVNLLLQSLELYGERMPHFLVKNWGLCDEWGQIDEDPKVREAIEKYGVKEIDFPKLGYSERYFLNKNTLSFAEAKEDKRLSILGRQRVSNFLKSAYEIFDLTEAWNSSNSLDSVGVLCESA